MAVWQSTLYLVPKLEVVSLFQTVPRLMVGEWFYEIKWYQNCEGAIYEKAFDLMLPRQYNPRASSDVLSWGTNNDNEIDMYFEDEKLTVLSVRINANQVNMNFISSIVDFASENDLLFWTLENNIFIEPVLETFLERFGLSRAMLFIRNPTIFFGDKKYLDVLKENLNKLGFDDTF